MEKPQDDGIWIIDTDAKTAYANERMAEILGTFPSEMVGSASFAYVFPEDVDEAQRLFDMKTRGDTKPFHFKLRRKDGSAVSVVVQGTPMHNAAGAFKGIVGTFSVSSEPLPQIDRGSDPRKWPALPQ
jgi:PAS domain S-box-containing protein